MFVIFAQNNDMPRPKLQRKMFSPPFMEGFKPFGTPINDVGAVTLLYEEYEAIKLTDYHQYNQEEAAKQMNVSRPTFTRIYDKARKTIAKAFVEGKAIFIEGGNVEFDHNWYKCDQCNHIFRTKVGDNLENCNKCKSDNITLINEQFTRITQNTTLATGPQKGRCVCIRCGQTTQHTPGVPCTETICSNCSSRMLRENSYHHKIFKNRQ